MGPFSEVAFLTTHSPEETQALGFAIGKHAQAGDVILLAGQLGAGKTCLTQGIAWGLGVKEYALSPSFVLVREYKGRLQLYHMDLYRLERLEEISDLGLDDYLYGKGVCVVEWADRGLELMPEEHLAVEIGYTSDTEREIILTGRGNRYRGLIAKLPGETEDMGWNCPLIPQQI
ncbi:MAG: tRNA (adenosine(37)-N6)-threonylcarbamoyltransferase complex ATPase subunit type 1 TsaE [Dehalococcoidia bacterium]|nr:tRNA (adenosine(37)-N6)-threonylcarbamoyltransferase complex ATPase subunit type 1 TsaE [Dehalococcoidia bacterium]